MRRSTVALILDDERVVADSLALVLQNYGYRAMPCYSPRDALALLSAMPIDVVILDVVMGEVTGIDVAIAARKLVPNCKIILFSGDPATAQLLEDAERGGNYFTCLAKPLHPNELLAQIGLESRQGISGLDTTAAEADD